MTTTDTTEPDEAAQVPGHLNQPALAKRRRLGRSMVVFAALIALFVSGWGMWHFFDDLPGLKGVWYLIVPMFLLFDVAGVACAVNARINRLAYGRMGIEGWLVWVFAILSGAMSSSDADGRAAAVRFAAPLVAAVLFELLIRGERKDQQGIIDGPAARLKRRILARVGLLDSIGQSDEDAAKRTAAGRLATLAYRMHQLAEGTRPRRRAEARFHRKLRTATERLQLPSDEDTIVLVRLHLAALYQSISGTSPEAVADLNLWRASDREPVRQVSRAGGGQVPELTAGRQAVDGVELTGQPGRAELPQLPDEPEKPTAAGRDMTDDEIMARFGPRLVATAQSRPNGQIGRTTIQDLCGIGSGRAQRIMARVNAEASPPPVEDEEEPRRVLHAVGRA